MRPVTRIRFRVAPHPDSGAGPWFAIYANTTSRTLLIRVVVVVVAVMMEDAMRVTGTPMRGATDGEVRGSEVRA